LAGRGRRKSRKEKVGVGKSSYHNFMFCPVTAIAGSATDVVWMEIGDGYCMDGYGKWENVLGGGEIVILVWSRRSSAQERYVIKAGWYPSCLRRRSMVSVDSRDGVSLFADVNLSPL
jgi:hypothetical protein